MRSGGVHKIKFPGRSSRMGRTVCEGRLPNKFSCPHCGIEVSPVVKSTDVGRSRCSEIGNTVGFKKVIQRNPISGIFDHNDIESGEVSVNELRARTDARQAALNEAHKADWSDPNSVDSPAYGNAMSRQPKPSDAVAGSGDRYGKADEQPPKKGGALQKSGHPEVTGIMPNTKGRG